MATRFVESDIKCPFYRDHHGKDIVCEGVYGNSRNIMRFTTQEDIDEWLNEACSKVYDLCPVYRMIMREKYAKEKL